MAGLYRPGSRPADSPSSWSKWKGGYTAGRMADIGSPLPTLVLNVRHSINRKGSKFK